jgi:hypothetical protein
MLSSESPLQGDIRRQKLSNIGVLTAANILTDLLKQEALERETGDFLLQKLNCETQFDSKLLSLMGRLKRELLVEVCLCGCSSQDSGCLLRIAPPRAQTTCRPTMEQGPAALSPCASHLHAWADSHSYGFNE